jgi:hypothetical protein
MICRLHVTWQLGVRQLESFGAKKLLFVVHNVHQEQSVNAAECFMGQHCCPGGCSAKALRTVADAFVRKHGSIWGNPESARAGRATKVAELQPEYYGMLFRDDRIEFRSGIPSASQDDG